MIVRENTQVLSAVLYVGELIITTGGIAFSVAAIGEAVSMMLVVGAIGVSAALVLYITLEHTDTDIRVEVDGQDLIAALAKIE